MSGWISAQFVLLALWLLVLFTCFVFGKYNADRTRHDIRPLLMVSSALLVIMAGLFWWGAARGTAFAAFSLLVALGMFASFLGDLTLAEYLPTPHSLIYALVVFGLGHILYISAYLSLVPSLTLDSGLARWIVLGGFLAFGVILWATLVRSDTQPAALNYGALGYTLLIAAMTGLAVSLGVAMPRLWMPGAGAMLYLASDTILGNSIFRHNKWFLVRDVAWILYIVGQALIVWSNWAAFSLTGGG